MKKMIAVILSMFIALCLTGCSKKVEYISNGTVQTNNDTSIDLFFSLLDKDQKEMKSDGKVEVKIINDSGETVYSNTFSFTEDDFNTYSNAMKGEMLMCKISVPMSKITSGKSSSGTFYYTVSKEDTYYFEQLSEKIYSDLPIAEAKLSIISSQSLPCTVNEYSWNKKLQSTVKITDVRYGTDEYSGTTMTIVFMGEKTYDSSGNNHSDNCEFSWRVLDKDGYVVDSGTVFTSELKVGDKFNNESAYVFNVVPGEQYYLELLDYSY